MKVIIEKCDDGSNDELSCEACCFHYACMQTDDLPKPFGNNSECKPGVYWTLKIKD